MYNILLYSSLVVLRVRRRTSPCRMVAQSTVLANTQTSTPHSSTLRSSSKYLSSVQHFGRSYIYCHRNKTYRLRIINSGSLVAEQFSVDNHLLTVVEADGTAVEPVVASSVFPVIAQRYSVLITTNQTAGAYWVRMNLDSSAFTVSFPIFRGITVLMFDIVFTPVLGNSSLWCDPVWCSRRHDAGHVVAEQPAILWV